MSQVPDFETERLYLRSVTQKDIPAYEKHFVDYEVVRYLNAAVPWPYPKNGVDEYIRNQILPYQGKTKWIWGIFLRSNPDELIGAIDINEPASKIHRGFWLSRLHWGNGYMTEAVRPVMDYAFGHLGFEKMRFDNAHGNIQSRRIKEKTGARLIGVEPATFVDPAYKEREVWEITKEEWLSHQKAIKIIS